MEGAANNITRAYELLSFLTLEDNKVKMQAIATTAVAHAQLANAQILAEILIEMRKTNSKNSKEAA